MRTEPRYSERRLPNVHLVQPPSSFSDLLTYLKASGLDGEDQAESCIGTKFLAFDHALVTFVYVALSAKQARDFMHLNDRLHELSNQLHDCVLSLRELIPSTRAKQTSDVLESVRKSRDAILESQNEMFALIGKEMNSLQIGRAHV